MHIGPVVYGALGGIGIAVFVLATVLIIRDWKRSRSPARPQMTEGLKTTNIKTTNLKADPQKTDKNAENDLPHQPPPQTTEPLKEKRAGEAEPD